MSAFPPMPDVLRWNAPGLALSRVLEPAFPPPPSVEDLQALEQAAHDEGYACGHAEGVATGVAEALADLAVRIAGTLIGRAYVADPTLLADLVREALDAVGSGHREMELRLHPDDFGVLAPHLAGLDGVRLTVDSGLGRGELRLHSESVRIDGTLAARLQSVLDATLASSSQAMP